LLAVPVAAQNLAGKYQLSSQGTSLTLELFLDGQGNLTGSLSSSTGMRYRVEGVMQDGVGVGMVTDGQSGSYFEAHPQGNELMLALIEPDANSMPDYNNVQQLLFTRQGAASLPGSGSGFGASSPPAFGSQPPSTAPAFQPAPSQGLQAPPGSGKSAGEVSDPQWGYGFNLPAGWKWQKSGEGALLGHDTIAGLIVVFPHTAGSYQEVQSWMREGLQEEGVMLSPSGPIKQLGSNAMGGDYQGLWEGQQARARGIGTWSPNGGGAIIIAVSTPEKFSPQLSKPAEDIARSMRYFKVDVSTMTKHFAGYWWYYSGTSSISHERIIYLGPDGTYSEKGEDAANVGNYDQYGNMNNQYLGNYQDRTQGRWTVRGNKNTGVIAVTRANGSSFEIGYQVKSSNNQKYGDYYFNGKLYHWITEKDLASMGYK